MIFLSIIIPCYNVEKYLPTTLQSLSNLRNKEECEFIFVNDGSTDSTLDIVESFVQQDNRSVLINQQNQGVSVARNVALDIAKGKYILCLDGDDYLHCDTIDIIKNNIFDADALLAPCTIVTSVKEKIQQIKVPVGIYTIDELYAGNGLFPTAPMIIYRSSIIKENNIYFAPNIKSGEVYDFTVSFFVYSKRIAIIKDSFYYYVMRETSATHMPNYKSDLSVLYILEHFSLLSAPWAVSGTFTFTALNMVLSFTYNKYMKNGLTDGITITELSKVFNNHYFRDLFKSIQISKLDIKYRIFIFYIKYMPLKFGYLLGACIMKIKNKLKVI